MPTYCSNCGAEQKGNEKFCAKCGQELKPSPSPKGEKKPSKTSKKSYGFFNSFNISEEELNNQIENYNTLSVSKTSRGIAVMTITGLLIIGTLLGLVLAATSSVDLSFSDILWSLVIYVPLLYFVYKGHLWAIIALGLWYTVDKFYTAFIISPTHFNIGTIIFWIIGVGPLWVAFRVERAHRRKRALVPS